MAKKTISGTSRNDLLNGTSGSDILDAGSGDDIATYVLAQNAHTADEYDGGSGVDTLRLVLTRAEWQRAAVQADVARYLGFIADETNPSGQSNGHWFEFAAFDLTVRKFENLQVMVDGVLVDPNDEAVVARNDAAGVSEDGTVQGNVLSNDDVPDGLQSVQLLTAPAHGALALGANGSYSYTPGAFFNTLAAGETAIESFTYRVTDTDGDSATATATITIAGTNDAPTVTVAVSASGAEDTGAFSVNLLAGASDVDHGSSLHVENVVWTGGSGMPADFTVAGSSIAVNTDAYDGIAQGQTFEAHFNYDVVDELGARTAQSATIAIAGTNDGPQITGGVTTGAVKEDVTQTATGQLTAFDPDQGDTRSWSVAGGTTAGNADYEFRADSFTIVRNNAVLWQDGFDDGIAPPSTPAQPNGATSYSGVLPGEFGEAGGKLIFDDEHATSFVGVGSPDPIIGNDLIARTDINPASPGGLKSTANFSVEGVFDVVVPDSPREGYGIRLFDRLVGGSGTPADQEGDDAIDLRVQMSAQGTLRVVLREVDFVADQTTTIQSLPFAPPADADQIRLRLEHSTTDVGALHASFEYLHGGAVIGGSQQTFTQIGRIFGTETPGFTGDDENWTRAVLIASAPATDDSILNGKFGTLTINQAGSWSYQLDNARTVTQNLAEGQSDTDVFQVTVTDEHGASDTGTVTINVAGTNDGPVMQTADVSRALDEDASANLTATGLSQFGDVDLIDTHSAHPTLASVSLSQGGDVPAALLPDLESALTAAVENEPLGDGHWNARWDFALANDAVQFLAAGQTLTLDYELAVEDNHGASATQDIRIVIRGTNDAPEITSAQTTGAVSEAANDSADEQNNVSHEASGVIAFADADVVDVHGATVTAAGGSYLGTFQLDPVDQGADSVRWRFSVADADLDGLDEGATIEQSYVVTVSDGHGGTTSETVTVSVNGSGDTVVNQAPLAFDDSRTTDEDHALTASVPAATDADGVVASYVLDSTVAQGTLAFNADGSYTYDPAGAFEALPATGHADVSFSYHAVDDEGASSAVSTVTIDVAGRNDAPAVAETIPLQSVSVNNPFALALPADLFSDADGGDVLTISVGASGGGSLPAWLTYDAPTQTLSGTPGPTDAGLVQVVVTATDTSGASESLLVPVTVLDGAVVDGTELDDLDLTGTINGDHIRGLGGNDHIVGIPGADLLEGGNGHDQLFGEAGDDVLDGGAGNDNLQGGSGNDVLFGGDGFDNLTGGAGNDHMEGGADADNLNDSEGGADVLLGGDGNDNLSTFDWFNGNGGPDTLDGGAGDDFLSSQSGGTNVFGTTLAGGEGNDTLLLNLQEFSAVSATAVMSGGAGNDTILVQSIDGDATKQVVIDGGEGNDTLNLSGVRVQATVTAGAGDDRIEQANNFPMSVSLGAGSDTIVVDTNWNGSSVLTVSDFAAGGDRFEITSFLNSFSGWDGSSNPFGAGFMRLTQDGADTLLQIDRNGGGDSYATLARLQGVDATTLTSANFTPPYPPDGSTPAGLTIDGDGFDNVLTGTIGADALHGFGGNDRLSGGPGSDTLDGGDGHDQLFGEAGNDVLDGGTGDDNLQGGSGNDVLFGGDGFDNLTGGAGNDHMEGGADADNLNDSEGGADVLLGGDGNDNLSTFDWFNGNGGPDTLDGGAGDDFLSSQSGGTNVFGTTLAGGEGNDTLLLNLQEFSAVSATAVMSGGAGNDTILVQSIDGDATKQVVIDGGEGNDTLNLSGVRVQATVTAGAGDDRIEQANNFPMSVSLGAGSDTIVVDTNWNGSSVLTVSDFAAGGDRFEITSFLNSFSGWDGSSNPFGAGFMRLTQDGADTLLQIDRNGGGDSYATLARLQGVDATTLTSANFTPPYPPDGSTPAGLTIDGDGFDNVLTGTIGADALHGFGGNDRLSGGPGSDTLDGGDGHDQLFGEAGNDVLDGGTGDDNLQGGSGNDVLFGGDGFDNLTGGAGNDHMEGGADADNLNDSEGGADVLLGGDGNDNLSTFDWFNGNGGPDTLDGGAGDDFLSSQSGGTNVFGTTLAGGEGNDTLLLNRQEFSAVSATAVMSGGAGNDTILVQSIDGDATKQVVIDGGEGNDTLNLSGVRVQATVTAGAGDDRIEQANNFPMSVSLGAGSDTIVVDTNWNGSSVLTVSDFAAGGDRFEITSFLNSFSGWDGSSNPFGAGFMRLTQDGADTLLQIDRNGGGDSYATLARLQGVDATTLTLDNFNPKYPPDGSGIFGTTFAGDADPNTITGTFGDDVLSGLGGADTLRGGNGNDQIDGGAGADTLTGGFGSDIFVYASDGEGVDVITDFQIGLFGDVLDLKSVLTGFDGNLADFVQLSASGADTLVSVDANGGGDHAFVALTTLQNVTFTAALLNDLAAAGNLVVA